MIGGRDIIIPTRLPPMTALSAACRTITQRWGKAVLQSATNGTVFRSFREVPFSLCNELIVYADQAAMESWEQLGADPSNDGTMIHLLSYGYGQLTVVVDDKPSPQITSLVNGIKDLIADLSLPYAYKLAA